MGTVTPGVAQTQPFHTQNQHQHGQEQGRRHQHLPASPACSQQLLQPWQMCSTLWGQHFGLQEGSLEAAEEAEDGISSSHLVQLKKLWPELLWMQTNRAGARGT